MKHRTRSLLAVLRQPLLSIVLLLVLSLSANAQWTWTAVAPMPMPSTNHAFCAANVNGAQYAYVFGGITTGLTNDNIHRHAYRYDVANNLWEDLPDVPDTLGVIASAASVIGDTAYVIGGYYVLDGPPYEISSTRVHRLDLTTNTWLTDGAPIPQPIDDHVQVVWRDSLIFVITGWSNTTNVANVQVYDPAHNTWSIGTAVPNNGSYKAFGASGVIIGDTIWYHGGARIGPNFPAVADTRMGVVDPLDPLQITWSLTSAQPSLPLYRGGAFAWNHRPHFVGGSAVSYNFDAVAYNGSGIVAPLARIIQFDPITQQWTEANDQPVAVMDLRGVGQLDADHFMIAGGIGADQTVLAGSWILQPLNIGLPEAPDVELLAYPNPAGDHFTVRLPATLRTGFYTLFDAFGRMLQTRSYQGPEVVLDLRDLPPGSYVLELSGNAAVRTVRFWSTNWVR
jgi:Galactose oxidase, central domain